MAKPVEERTVAEPQANGGARAPAATDGALAADIIIANAPDPVFVFLESRGV